MTKAGTTIGVVAVAAAVTAAAIMVAATGQQQEADIPPRTWLGVAIMPSTAGGLGTLAEQRAAVLETGVIPDEYLISQIGTSWHGNSTTEELEIYEEATINSIAAGIDMPYKDQGTKYGLAHNNFRTLMEKPDTDMREVFALMIYRTVLDGTYEKPDNELRLRYYDHLLTTYRDKMPHTIQETDDRIVRLLGEMAPLAQAIFDLRMEGADRGLSSFEQLGEDPDYWWAVMDLHQCEYNLANGYPDNDDCAGERERLENEERRKPEPDNVATSMSWPPEPRE